MVGDTGLSNTRNLPGQGRHIGELDASGNYIVDRTQRRWASAEEVLVMGADTKALLVILCAHDKVGGVGINQRGETSRVVHMDEHRSVTTWSY